MIPEAKQEFRMLAAFRMWKLKTDFSFLVTKIQNVPLAQGMSPVTRDLIEVGFEAENSSDLY